MYGIFPYIYHKKQLNVGIYTIHGSYGTWIPCHLMVDLLVWYVFTAAHVKEAAKSVANAQMNSIDDKKHVALHHPMTEMLQGYCLLVVCAYVWWERSGWKIWKCHQMPSAHWLFICNTCFTVHWFLVIPLLVRKLFNTTGEQSRTHTYFSVTWRQDERIFQLDTGMSCPEGDVGAFLSGGCLLVSLRKTSGSNMSDQQY